MPIHITGTGSALPELRVTNFDMEKLVDTNDEWIFSRTGIKARHVLQDETLYDLTLKASQHAMEASKANPEDIELIICATFTSASGVPSLAAEIRKGLGCTRAVAFDINAACTGFIYAMTIAESMMKTAGYQKALVIGAEALSKYTDWTDRETCILFGDGAGAAVLEQSEEAGIIDSILEGQIDTDNALTLSGTKSENPFSNAPQANVAVKMNGKAVFAFAVNAMSKLIKELSEKANVSIEEIAVFVPHQANVRIIKSTATRLGIGIDKFFMNIEDTGNTSAASIGIALDELYQSKRLKKGDLVMAIGFGGGFTSGAVLYRV
ncbi:MAG: hypothetical protein BGN88_14930 [Clostridiales bacterium 43-6]|nr:MAG: hypothetical protein BGN88_14930 [Clostridiales bacterium 43-6]